MADQRWKPSVTVAAVIEQDGRYLLVEERTAFGLRLNNPAGHLDPGEGLVEGAAREALEETARPFTPQAVVGIYLARTRLADGQDITYLRFAFTGPVGEEIPGQALDEPVERTLWMTLAEVRASVARHRSPLVLRCIEDHAAGQRFSLDVLHVDASVAGLPTSPTPGPFLQSEK